jgi:hypothetical protein
VKTPARDGKEEDMPTHRPSPPPGAGLLWIGGWLFTIGFAKLVWWKAALAVVLWPYFLGATVRL